MILEANQQESFIVIWPFTAWTIHVQFLTICSKYLILVFIQTSYLMPYSMNIRHQDPQALLDNASYENVLP